MKDIPQKDDVDSSPIATPKKSIPRHIAIILDGNGRWAQKRGLPRSEGHIRGSSAIEKIIEEAAQIGVER
ncbi:MAG: undecaprenyl diphosphate synthase family protein, partial [Thermoguttaceae bacterium]